MESNLIIYSNIYPWNGRWRRGDKEFMSKIWDFEALRILDKLAKKKEVVLTPYQHEIFECSLPCSNLPKGDNPWGHDAKGTRVCFCRNSRCAKFTECRGGNGMISEREREIWSRGNQNGLGRFNEIWEINRNWHADDCKWHNIVLDNAYKGEEFEKVPQVDPNARHDPKFGFEYPDDEEFEDVALHG